MSPQVLVMTLELREHGHPYPLVVNGIPLALGESTRDRYGLDAVVDERLVRYIALLSIRRLGGVLAGWTTADELGYLADDGGTGGAAAKFLERRLLPQNFNFTTDDLLTDKDAPSPFLIKFAPRRTDSKSRSRGGMSRGPYQLDVTPARLIFSEDIAWSWLAPSIAAGNGPIAAPNVLAEVRRYLESGDLIAARRLAAAGVRTAITQLRFEPSNREHRFLLASLWDLVSNLDMELGQPKSSLNAADRAERLYMALRHPAGIAHATQVRSHALGQLEDVSGAVDAARRAKDVLERARAIRVGAGRANYSGVLGQQLSKVGRYVQAERHLAFAQQTCEQAGLKAWAGVWALRRCESAITSTRLALAEYHLDIAHALFCNQTMNVPQRAAFTRITAQFFCAASRLEEARRWAIEGYRIGILKGMANQIRLLIPIMNRLEISRDEIAKLH